MPVYHLVFHSFGSWLPDQQEGYHNRKQAFRQHPNAGLAHYYRSLIQNQNLCFSDAQQKTLLHQCLEFDQILSCHVHAVAVVSTHVHLVIGWSNDSSVLQMKSKIKQRLTYILNKDAQKKSGQWFSRGAGVNKILDMNHMIKLVKQYIPHHGENMWIEDRIQLHLR